MCFGCVELIDTNNLSGRIGTNFVFSTYAANFSLSSFSPLFLSLFLSLSQLCVQLPGVSDAAVCRSPVLAAELRSGVCQLLHCQERLPELLCLDALCQDSGQSFFSLYLSVSLSLSLFSNFTNVKANQQHQISKFDSFIGFCGIFQPQIVTIASKIHPKIF